MSKIIGIIGQRFGRLIALDAIDGKRSRFRCDCGKEIIAYRGNVTSGLTRSCGCLRREVTSIRNATHGYTRGGSKSKTYAAWGSMLERCNNPHNKQYKDWGGRGIRVCDRWLHSFENFLTDMGECPPGMTLNRINNNLGYTSWNCEWINRTAQNRNKRNNKMTVEKAALIRLDLRKGVEIARTYGVSKSLISQIKAGRIWR